MNSYKCKLNMALKEKFPQERLLVVEASKATYSCIVKCLKCNSAYEISQAYSLLGKSKQKVCSKCFPYVKKSLDEVKKGI